MTGTTTSTMTIEQGPEWLVDLYFTPPPWLNPLLKVIAIFALVVVAYRLYQRGWHLDMDTQRGMQIVVAHIVAIMSATLAMVNLANQPYFVDVSVGFASGYGTVLAAQYSVVASWLASAVPNVRQRRATVWMALGVAAFGLPPLVAVDGAGIMLSSSRMLLLLMAESIATYDIMLDSNQSEPEATGR